MIELKSGIKGILILLLIIGCSNVFADSDDDDYQHVIIDDPFIEMHSGPGRGYPVFHIVEKGEEILLIKKKTQWYKIKSPRGKLGWVHEDEMERTLTPEGQKYETNKPDKEGFVNRDFEAGVMAGDFEGANVMTLYAGWNWTPNITTELAVSQALGNVSDIQFANISIMHQPFPEWVVSPYVKLGTGIIKTKPRATLVFPEDREDEMLGVGLGFRAYVSRQFFLRAEYNSYTILTNRNDNDQVEEWKLGFSVYF